MQQEGTKKKSPDALNQQELLLAIYKTSQKINRQLRRNFIISIIKLLFLVAPIVVAFIYLPTYFNRLYNDYSTILETLETVNPNQKP